MQFAVICMPHIKWLLFEVRLEEHDRQVEIHGQTEQQACLDLYWMPRRMQLFTLGLPRLCSFGDCGEGQQVCFIS